MNLIEAARMALVGVRGSERYLEAIAMGDVADASIVALRRAVCRGCPSRVRKALPGAKKSDWCGPPLKETGRTCGCLLAGKSIVASESCPQRKWGAVVPGFVAPATSDATIGPTASSTKGVQL